MAQNNSIIKQSRVSSAINHFKQGFLKKWNLSNYYDINAPAVFLGVYTDQDVLAIKNHKGFKLVVFCGRDIFNAQKFKDINCYFATGVFQKELSIYGNRVKSVNICIKDYSEFKPGPLGDKIYCYMRTKESQHQLGYKVLIELMHKIGKEQFIIGYLGNDMTKVINDYYAKSFINLNFNPVGGITSVFEMAHMGIKSVSNYKSPFTIGYESIDDIVKTIELERKKIGTIQNKVSEDAINWVKSDNEWLTVGYYI